MFFILFRFTSSYFCLSYLVHIEAWAYKIVKHLIVSNDGNISTLGVLTDKSSYDFYYILLMFSR